MKDRFLSDSLLKEHRSKFPALTNKSYLNFGAQGSLPSSSINAIKAAYDYVQEQGPLSSKMFLWIVEQGLNIKQILKEEFGGKTSEYALTQNATEGCNIVLWGLDWQEGDSLLTSDSEHNGVMKAAIQLCKRKKLNLEICPLAEKSDEEILENLKQALKRKPRLFMVSHVLWNTGRVLPVKEMTELCRQQDVLVLIDGAQSAGVLPLNLPEINADFYACTGHKWLCGPEGVGFLHVSSAALEKLEPTFAGWRSAVFDVHGNPVNWAEGAARFEVATAPFPLLSGFKESMRLHHEAGGSLQRYELIRENARKLKQELHKIPGIKLLDENGCSSLVSFAIAGVSHTDLVKKLDARSIIVRTIPKPDCIRASVHYFSRADLDNFVSGVKEILAV